MLLLLAVAKFGTAKDTANYSSVASIGVVQLPANTLATTALGQLLSNHILPYVKTQLRLDLREALFATERVHTIFEKSVTEMRAVFSAFSDEYLAAMDLLDFEGSPITIGDRNIATGQWGQ